MQRYDLLPPEAEKYVKQVYRELRLPRGLRTRVVADLQSDIAAALEAGESTAQIVARMGPPAELAAELSRNYQSIQPTGRQQGLRIARGGAWMLLFASGAGLLLWLIQLVLPLIYRVTGGHLGSAGSIGIIGGADGPTRIFVTTSVTGGLFWPCLLVLAIALVILLCLNRQLHREKND
ncbi:hypothetical protein H8K20_04110 [Neobittarella massiliensis]|uniref:Uncharacterized protein n=1 Tax=Neobittarella massiliensis (ex Bilen et al. 2018) TaxID=2041842 RepID=A0A8J6LTM1_9FIRM|nr:hypothetical protein [Neobittarella massiliensis]MBC3515584.1 hypothetical protein [Neobittarella massiliensis]